MKANKDAILKEFNSQFEKFRTQISATFDYDGPFLEFTVKSELYDVYTKEKTWEYICPVCGKITVRNSSGGGRYGKLICQSCGFVGGVRYIDSLVEQEMTTVFPYSGGEFIAYLSSTQKVNYDDNGIGSKDPREITVKAFAAVSSTSAVRFVRENDTLVSTTKKLAAIFGAKAPVKYFGGTSSVAGVATQTTWSLLPGIESALNKTRTSAATKPAIPAFTVPDIEAKDIANFMLKIETMDNHNNVITGQAWCTSCDNVFDINVAATKSAAERSLVYPITCPDCGVHFERSIYGVGDSGIVNNIAHISSVNGDVHITMCRCSISNNWEKSIRPYALSVISRDGKIKRYATTYNNGSVWVPTRSAMYRSFDKVAFAGPDDLGIRDAFRGSYFRLKILEMYIIKALQNPALATLVKDPETAKKITDSLEYGRELNWGGQTEDEIFGAKIMSDEFKDISADFLLQLNKVSTNFTPEVAKYLSEARIGMPFIRRIFSFGFSLEEIANYLKKVDEEQGLLPCESLTLWTEYMQTLVYLGRDISGEEVCTPDYLHTEYDKAKRALQNIIDAGETLPNLISRTAELYKRYNYSSAKVKIDIAESEADLQSAMKDLLLPAYSYTYRARDTRSKLFIARRVSNNKPFAIIELDLTDSPRVLGTRGNSINATEKNWIKPFLDQFEAPCPII